ncbi:hypothetical protein ACWD6R_15375 [Streptomyces sp. NPDC005151]
MSGASGGPAATAAGSPGSGRHVELGRRAYEIWDETAYDWTLVPGTYEVQAARSLGDVRLMAATEIKE